MTFDLSAKKEDIRQRGRNTESEKNVYLRIDNRWVFLSTVHDDRTCECYQNEDP